MDSAGVRAQEIDGFVIEVMDEIEDILQIQCAPMNWPIGMGRQFKGVYDTLSDF